MKMTMNRRAALLGALCAILGADNAVAFTSSPAVDGVRKSLVRPRPSSPSPSASTSFGLMPASVVSLNAKKSSTDDMEGAARFPRLSAEEEMALLRQTVEHRRLVKLEEEMTLQSPTNTLPLLSIRARQAGYGEEWEAYEDAIYQGQLARETLVTRNMGLVHFCVSNILGNRRGSRLNSLSREDLVQEGAIGLARAVDKWNPAIGGKFSTYAVYWVRAAVLRCIAERDDVVRVPDHISRAVRQVNQAAKRLGLDMDAEGFALSASWKDAQMAKALAEEAGLSDRNFQEAMKARSRRYTGGYVSFEAWMQNGKDLVTDVPTNSADQGFSSIETEAFKSTISQFLRPKEMEALSLRYGLNEKSSDNSRSQPTTGADYLAQAERELFGSVNATPEKSIPVKGKWGEAMSFKEVGKHMQVSAEYGRKLCHAALKKLQDAAADGRLEPSLMF